MVKITRSVAGNAPAAGAAEMRGPAGVASSSGSADSADEGPRAKPRKTGWAQNALTKADLLRDFHVAGLVPLGWQCN